MSILNADDPSVAYFHAIAGGRWRPTGGTTRPMCGQPQVEARANGTAFTVTAGGWSGRVDLRLPGSFNVHNALAVMALARVEGIDLDLAARALGAVTGVPGRMETVDLGQPFGVVVDYAHTADSLGKVLRILRPLASGRVIAVFGSAGERDPTKRPAMGRASAELADVTIVTDEDPRLEDPRLINEAIAEAPAARARGRRDAVRDRRPPDGDRPRHRPGAGRRRDPAGRQGPREDDHLRHRGALVGREGGRATGPARRRLRWSRCLSSAPGASPIATTGMPSSSTRPTAASRSCGSGASCASHSAGGRCAWPSVRPCPATAGRGAQVLIRDVPLVKWRLGYAPRGPVGDLDDPAVRAAMTSALRALARDEGSPPSRSTPRPRPTVRSDRALLDRPGGERPGCSRRARA